MKKINQKAQDLEKFVQAILSEQIKVGEVIRQNELCEILNTSLSPLRELLVLLEELELVEVKPRSGFQVIYPGIDSMGENMQFRVMIEMHAIEAFLEVVSDEWIEEQISQHKTMLHGLETAEDLTTQNSIVLDIDRSFHRTIVASALAAMDKFAGIPWMPLRKSSIGVLSPRHPFRTAYRDLNCCRSHRPRSVWDSSN